MCGRPDQPTSKWRRRRHYHRRPDSLDFWPGYWPYGYGRCHYNPWWHWNCWWHWYCWWHWNRWRDNWSSNRCPNWR